MLWMLKVYRATDSERINSWMNSLSIPFLAKCLSPEHQLLRVAVKTFCPCILASEVREGVWDQSASSLYQYSCVYVNTDYLHGASILQLPPGMGPETSTYSTPSPALHLSSHTEKGSGSWFSLLWEIIMHELIHAVSSGQTQVVGLIAWVLLSWITLCLPSLEVCIQIIAVGLLARRSLLRCTNFITYLSKQRRTESREGERREKEGGRETFCHWCVFMDRHGCHGLDCFTQFWGSISHGISCSTIPVSLTVLHCHRLTVNPVCKSENMPPLILHMLKTRLTPKDHREF